MESNNQDRNEENTIKENISESINEVQKTEVDMSFLNEIQKTMQELKESNNKLKEELKESKQLNQNQIQDYKNEIQALKTQVTEKIKSQEVLGVESLSDLVASIKNTKENTVAQRIEPFIHTYIHRGKPKEVNSVKIHTRRLNPIIKKIDYETIRQFTSEQAVLGFAKFFQGVYRNVQKFNKIVLQGDNQEEINQVISILVNRGIYTQHRLKNITIELLESLMKPIYGQDKYLLVYKYVSNIIKHS